MRVPIPLIGPSYSNRELPLSAQVTKNLYPQINPESRSIVSLHAFPGLKPFSTPGGANRGMHVMADRLYSVSGSSLFEIAPSGTATDRGGVAGSSICGFADNGTQMFVVNGQQPSLYNSTTTSLDKITDTDVVNPTTVAYLNSQFVMDHNKDTSGKFVTTQVLTLLTPSDVVGALDFAEADTHPDDILRVVTFNQLIYFFGSESLDPWWNSGVGSPPFDKVQGAAKPYGLAGKDALGILDDMLYFLDNNRVPQKMVGLSIASIGNIPLGKEWQTYAKVSDVIVFPFRIDHQVFVYYTFPSANRSWLYHEASGSWAQMSYGVDNARHRMVSHAFVYGKHLVGDHSNGTIYELDFSTFTDNAQVIQRQRTTATIHGGLYEQPGKKLFFNEVEFIMQTGEGITTGQGSDPQAMVRFSDDGGRTYSGQEFYPLGAGGEYLTRVVMYDQGSAYQRLYEITYSEPTPFTLMSAHAEVDFGI